MRLTDGEYRRLTGTPARSKYGAKPGWHRGLHFDSRKEIDFFERCLLEHRAGKIAGVLYHGRLLLVDGTGPKDKAACYEPDFVVLLPDGTYRLVETKGMETDVYKLKKKLLRDRWPALEVETI